MSIAQKMICAGRMTAGDDTRALRLVAITAGMSVPSTTRMLSDRLVSVVQTVLERDGHEVHAETIDLRPLAHDIVDASLAGFPVERLRAASELVQNADGIVAVTPTFNLSYSGLFKSFIDVLEPGTFTGVPVALGATGGTARHSLAIDYAMASLFGYLKADVVPTKVFAASEDFGSVRTALDERDEGDGFEHRVLRVGTELAQYMLRFAGREQGAITPTRALGTVAAVSRRGDAADSGGTTAPVDQRGRAGALDEFDDFVPMDDLLG